MAGRMAAALQVALRVSGAGQHFAHRLDMARLARVAGAQQRDLRHRIAVALDTSGGDEGKRLERLQALRVIVTTPGRRAPRGGCPRRPQPQSTAMHAFDGVARVTTASGAWAAATTGWAANEAVTAT